MSTDSQDTHLKFSHTNSQAYSGFEKTAVPAEDPELTHTDPGTPMGNFHAPVLAASVHVGRTHRCAQGHQCPE